MVDISRLPWHSWSMPRTKPAEQGTRLPPLLPLPAETWGQRFRRARGDVTLEDAAERISALAQPVSYMVPARLEQLVEPPKSRRSQVTAVLFLLSYGIDPAEFDLDVGLVPSSIDLRQILFANSLRPVDTDIARHIQARRSLMPQPVAC